MQTIHSKKFGGIHPVTVCPVMGTAQNAFCESIEMVEKTWIEWRVCRNYKYIQVRTRDDQL